MGGLIISPLSHPSKKSPIQSKICCKRQIKNDHKLIWIRIRISGGAFFFPLGNRCLSQSVYIDFYCQTLAHTHMYKYQITGTNCSHAAESGDSCDIFIQTATSCQEVELTNQKKNTKSNCASNWQNMYLAQYQKCFKLSDHRIIQPIYSRTSFYKFSREWLTRGE